MPDQDYSNDIERALTVLKNGGIILYPTDTIWGIGCDATNASAVKRIYALKKRSDSKAMIILAATDKGVQGYVRNPSQHIFQYLKSTSKPTTVIYMHAINLPAELLAEDDSVAIRIVNNDFCKELITRLNRPLVSTSANISGDASPANFSEVSAEIKNGVDYIVNYRQNDLTPHQPSSIVRLNNDNSIQVIRP